MSAHRQTREPRSWKRIAAAAAAVLLLATPGMAEVTTPGELNPIEVLQSAADAVPGMDGKLSTTLNILVLLTVLSLAPSILILCTCFTRFVIVLGLLRQALGTQSLPPSQVIVGLSLFITFVVMTPTMARMYEDGIKPYVDGQEESYEVAWDRTKQPLRDFMFSQLEATGNWSGVYMMLNYRASTRPIPRN